MEFKNWIAGEVKDPAEGVDSSPMEIIQAITACKKAEAKWSRVSFQERLQKLLRWAEIIESRAPEWAKEEANATGIKENFLLQQNYRLSAEFLKNYVGAHSEDLAPSDIYRRALGTGVIFLPWIMGFRVFVERAASALYFGNTLIVKPSEKNPLIGNWIIESLKDLLDPPVVQVLHGRGESMSSILSAHPSIQLVDFVGRNGHGAQVLKEAGVHLGKRVRVLAGGQNSAVILDDCEFSQVIPELFKSAFSAQGQMAQNISRVFVSIKRMPEFLEALDKEIKNQNSLNDYSGRLLNGSLAAEFEKSMEEIQSEGGKKMSGEVGEVISPFIIKDLTMCSPYQQDEVYGPLLMICEYKYLHETEKWLNTGFHAHSAQIFGKDQAKIAKWASGLQVGTIWVNGWWDTLGDVPVVHKSSGVNYDSLKGHDEFYSAVSRVLTSPS